MNISTFGTTHPVLGFALAAIVCLLGTAAAWADVRSITVSFRDLDLSNPDGAKTLYYRIQTAAKTVCGPEETTMIGKTIWRGCVKGAVDDAVAKVNNPLLTALHTDRSPAVTAMLNK